MKRIKNVTILGVALLAANAWADEGQVRVLQLTPGKDRTTLLIAHTGEGKFRLFKSEKQGSVIIEAENLVLPAALTKLVDASASGGPVFQMTPYNSQHSGHAMAKLVLQLRGAADVSSTDIPGKFLVDVVRKAGTVANGRPLNAQDELKARQSAAQKSDEIARHLIEVLSSPQEDKRYFGSKVTFEAKDAEVPDIFRLVGESSDLNIIWDPDVEGQKTSLAVRDLPWDQLLDIVVQQKGYKATVMGNVVRIMTIDTFNRQSEAKKKEISLSDELEPVIMSVVPLGFTAAADMKKLISELIQEKNATATGAAAAAAAAAASDGGGKLSQDFKRGRIEVDERTNSLVITNTRDAIERIRRLVKELDVPVPQVLIDSKVIIATEQFSKNIGVSWSGGIFSSSSVGGVNGGVNGVTPPQFSEPAIAGVAQTAAASPSFQVSAPPGGGSFGIGIGTTNTANVRAALTLSEIDNLTKTVASPRVIVNNNKTANITDGAEVVITPPPNQGGLQPQPTTVKANLSLKVTPQVTSAGSVQLKDLSITKDDLGAITGSQVNTTTKTLTTDVLVDSGATLVLGGVYQLSSLKNESGIPLLKDLPFIGQLFRANTKSEAKEELMVFITPQIIDPQASSQSL